MGWKDILKEDMIELGDDHQQILTDMIKRLVNKEMEEELSKRNTSIKNLPEEEFQTLMEDILDRVGETVTEEYAVYLRNIQTKIQEENQ